ncbi:hypothetical protein GRI62_11735 [Erythrobacter arachoides]|uniref:Uncharacterized protein n=1 Tax=Aurantiacibacter arachoides TaxID=1850444 RepID=A0A845A532_9SPHN|nr:hypothetical protein [Aurantiacibacter arachoides]MXO94266.1 hypothetical protein [Aurantiacibacter arachoides]GGD64839.1 hypothetical protein GCM10011411_26420 [Aurantiacibacter arachoides]
MNTFTRTLARALNTTPAGAREFADRVFNYRSTNTDADGEEYHFVRLSSFEFLDLRPFLTTAFNGAITIFPPTMKAARYEKAIDQMKSETATPLDQQTAMMTINGIVAGLSRIEAAKPFWRQHHEWF